MNTLLSGRARAALTAAGLALFATTSAFAALSVSPIFGSDMVLQRNTTVPVFGTDAAGTVVTVKFNGQTVTAAANASGGWQANLASMAATTAPTTLTVSSADGAVTFTDVQVGEVWLCSGQSNMGKPLSYADNSAPYIADAGNHNIRLFKMTAGNGPSTTTWVVSNSTTAANFSAVGYWMGLDLSEDMNVPIGLVQATHDGTAIANWELMDGGTGVDYLAMVKAIQPFAVKGVAWYQGESNGGDSSYTTELTDMIGEWRSDWGLSSLPFGIVQLPAQKWTTCRLCQLKVTQTVANTYLVVTADLPGSSQLHPTAKYLVGIRCSIGARGLVYSEPIEFAGPLPQSVPSSFASGSTAILTYAHYGSGLFTGDSNPPNPFEIASASGRYQTGTGTIVGGNTIQVTSSVSSPATIQYAVSAAGNVFNHVAIPTEGGTKTVDRLPGSLFQMAIK